MRYLVLSLLTVMACGGSDPLAVSSHDAGPVEVTWTFISCGDNPITVGATDEKTNAFLAGPATIPRRMAGDMNSSIKLSFSCTPGELICPTSSASWMGVDLVCGTCTDAAIDAGC
jgi:hypothetical protein